jgi:hypothetical protein
VGDPTVVAAVEIWQPKLPSIDLPEYQKPVLKLRHHKRGGGICFWIKKGVTFSQLEQFDKLDLEAIEVLAVKINFGSISFLLITIYRPPNSNPALSIKNLETVFKTAKDLGLAMVLTGDMNIDLLKPNHPIARQYVNLLDKYQLTQHIKLSTIQPELQVNPAHSLTMLSQTQNYHYRQKS